ncbi:MAG: penicillin acylase family protein [Vicinamibacterales bacterium]
MRRLLRLVLLLLAVAVGLSIGAGFYARYELRASLPALDGALVVAGLGAPVTITRDALGVPTVTGASREDVARALGFLHAQDRFFQMDLQRRQPAGELSALVGPRALEVDQLARIHRMRNVAHRALELTGAPYRKILEAYAAGVNSGLAALGAVPFEYLVLRATPEPWQPEDSILTLLAMFNTLQGRQAFFEQSMAQLQDVLPEPMFHFLTAAGSEWETPVVGSPLVRPPIPGADVFDLRRSLATEAQRHRDDQFSKTPVQLSGFGWPLQDSEEAAIIGSNNWAVSGSHTATGAALVANDMHLAIGVPIIWYRASLVFPDPAQPDSSLRVTGVTLPGLPSLAVGSNGHVAWGFTNTGGDWSDLVRVEADPRDAGKYLTPDGPKAFETFSETIAAKGAASKTIAIRSTDWGPIVWKDAKGREYAQHWVAHDPEVLASDVTRPERSRSVDDLLATIAGMGIPNQNVTMGDETGRIAWTIGGAMPRRVGFDGFTPQSWADGSKHWDGYLPAAEFPRIVDPHAGRIWTANAPVVDGAMLATIGEGGFADGIRARLIRDRLMTIENATPADMLSVQLEDKALYLERWRKLLLDTLSGEPKGSPPPGGRGLQPSPLRGEFRRLVETDWNGRASPGSVAYRLVRTFRTTFVREVMLSLTARAKAIDPAFDYTRTLRGEGPVWAIVTERPLHLLDPKFASWDEALLAAIDASTDELTAGGRALGDRTWGEANSTQFVHPLAAAIPWFGRYLNMPSEPLAGDVYTPRASAPRTGPSERMAVSPGRESEGILQIPTGQSGHPLSPHYGDEYRAWLDGVATPFLPGPVVSTLTLAPQP